MSSRILIVSTNTERAPQPAVPIGAAWVAQALQVAGFEVKLLDLCFEKSPLAAVERAIGSFRPDGIGISVRNLDNCDFLAPKSYLPELKVVTDLIKRTSDAQILVGGAGVSVMPAEVLAYLDLPFAVSGAGEAAAVAFFGCRSDAERTGVRGVVGNGRGAGAGRQEPPDRRPVQPRLHRWVETERYLGLEPALPVQGKRGCANRCLYCTYNRIEGERWQPREAGAVAEEIVRSLAETSAREFEFVDSVFNAPPGYLETLMEEILRRGIRVRFRVSSLSPAALTKEQIRLMELAGIGSVVITPESASPATLAALGKGFDAADVHRAAGLFSNSSIKALWCFLVGGPGEDPGTLAETARFIDGSLPGKDCAFITAGIRIYPGTGLHRVALKEGVVQRDESLLMPRFYFSPQLAPQRAREILRAGVSDLSRCIFLSDTRMGSLTAVRRIGTMLRLPDPLWSYASFLHRLTGRSRVINRSWSPPPAGQK